MKKINMFLSCRKVFTAGLIIISLIGKAQSLSNGAVPYMPYMGAQPNIVHGVSAGMADSLPLVRHVYLVNDTIIGITIDAQSVSRTGLRDYVPQPNDSIVLVGPKIPHRLASVSGINDFYLQQNNKDSLQPAVSVVRYVYRNGYALGWLVGPAYKQYWPVEKMEGIALDTTEITKPGNIVISSVGSTSYKNGLVPSVVFRKSKPHVQARVGPHYEHDFGMRHDIFLVLKEPLAEGEAYHLTFKNKVAYLPALSFTLNTKKLRSEAIHVNLAGYHCSRNQNLDIYQCGWAMAAGWIMPASKTSFCWIQTIGLFLQALFF
ncbi:MAG: hypothetical protein HC896_12010 [Bacteroidales bacterium]|nr:hypothetical protein [Bacteroidales bacterium]